MENKTHRPTRKPIRLKKYDYSAANTYFVTICTARRACILSSVAKEDIHESKRVGAAISRPLSPILTSIGESVKLAIERISKIYPHIQIDDYVIMPNHVHLILTFQKSHEGLETNAPTLGTVINQLKGYVSRQVGFSLWQKSFYEHIVRDGSDYDEKMKYVHENPLHWYYDELYVKE